MSLIWILIGAVAVFCVVAYVYMTRLMARDGVTALATIIRISGAGGSHESTYRLTLRWRDNNGQKRTAEKNALCDAGDLPREGDQVEIVYLPNDIDYIEFKNGNSSYMRHDMLTPGGEL